MGPYTSDFGQIDRTQVSVVGGKGAHLGELSRIEGVAVPPGFCVTTDAFRRILSGSPTIDAQLDRLSRPAPDDRAALAARSAEIRETIEGIAIPDDLAAAITAALGRLGEQTPCAVRSSATAEDLPTASFAGQQDSWLNVVGTAAVLQHVRRCWASLFTERAVIYRNRNGVDHREVRMAVVVQQMVFSQASGVLFTADPVTGNRKTASVEAGFGLGEALVSGLVNPDTWQVRDGTIVGRTIGTQAVAIHASPGGGTEERAITRQQAALTDAQVVWLAALGRQIEAHFGRPQDIEWCLVDDTFSIVQSRPITTLFPVPETGDGENHVYVSVGHQQMMTDAMKPLGLSVWRMTARRRMVEAGGRLFIDVTRELGSPTSRAGLLATLGKSDPLIRDALETVVARGDFVGERTDEAPASPLQGALPPALEADPALVDALVDRSRTLLEAARREIRGKTGESLLDFVRADLDEMMKNQFEPRSLGVIMAVVEDTWWLNDHLETWLGEQSAADRLVQSAPNNVTSEMGLALLRVADGIRPHPEVVAFLAQVEDAGFLERMDGLAGGPEARAAIEGWLETYGMRGVGEIDITRPRFAERPDMLLPLVLGNVRNFAPGEGERRFAQGKQEAEREAGSLIRRLAALPDGARLAEETQQKIARLRTFVGYREYPKYAMVSSYFVYKQALMAEAARLVQAGALGDAEDIFFLRFEELYDVVRTGRVDEALLRQRKDAFASYRTLVPPRVLTSDGEGLSGAYHRDDLPPGALVGLAVSAGTVEGRARVVLDVAEADLAPGDILVTVCTDPSWTPLFVAIAGLVTEVGGRMTHGAVIAREYGLPAVVGVAQATSRIRDGQRIRVHGTDGYVEILP